MIGPLIFLVLCVYALVGTLPTSPAEFVDRFRERVAESALLWFIAAIGFVVVVALVRGLVGLARGESWTVDGLRRIVLQNDRVVGPIVATGETLHADLTGYEEVPAVSTGATGTFRAKIANDESVIDFELTYEGIEGGTVLAAHIHVGQLGVNGGVSAFFCGGPKPACPTPGGTVTGVILPADVIGPVGAQQVTPGNLSELIRAIRARVTYANVHSSVSPGGEILGQVRR